MTLVAVNASKPNWKVLSVKYRLLNPPEYILRQFISMFTAVMFTYFGSLKAVSIFEFD